ncbi:MAG: amino acid permease [Spirochaetes bacterium]|nr:amino acid permease [Spirochaetota bacterium]
MKFGTFKGVFVPSTEAILGTVLFLLLPTLVGDIGLIPMIGILLLAHSVTFATSFSLADCATNLNNIGGGGMYALSKRSLGKAFGGSIGIQLFFAQAASIGFYCIGFAEPLQAVITPFLKFIPAFAGTGAADILLQKQMIATAVYLIFFIFAIIGADFTLKIQILIFVILFSSIAAILISPLTGITFNRHLLYSGISEGFNLFGSRTTTVGIFFVAFATFFPAVTGIDAGVGMSRDLKDPKSSLVKGTFWAIGVTFCVYFVSTVIFSLMRPESLVTEYINGNPSGNILTDLLGFQKLFPFNIMGVMVLVGILFATSSSALSCFMTAPRTLQSISRDDLLPRITYFLSNDFKKGGNEPRFATLITFFIGLAVIWMGSLNLAATIVGISYLVVYGWVNGSAFLERISGNPTFRPTSRGHWLISLYGFLSALIAIILFSWVIGLGIVITQFIIFQLLLKYKAKGKLEGVWWGVLFSLISRGLKALNKIVMGTKNWRPIMSAITFSEKDSNRKQISQLASVIAAHKGIVSLNVLAVEKTDEDDSSLPDEYSVPATLLKVGDMTQSILSIVQLPVAGGMELNTILLEYTKKIDNVKVLNKILALNKNVLLLKNGSKFGSGDKIDIWWRGEKNGNFMVLLAYIMSASLVANTRKAYKIRIIRRLNKDEPEETATDELTVLLKKARLSGEVVILPYSEDSFDTVLRETSSGADLVMMGMPGNYIEKEKSRLFNLNKFFFEKEIEKYNDMPAILFIKSAYVMNLIED